jgi:hypothetical protein
MLQIDNMFIKGIVMIKIHPQARTTPLIRYEIQASSLSTAELVKLYNSSKSTIAKWRQRTEKS